MADLKTSSKNVSADSTGIPFYSYKLIYHDYWFHINDRSLEVFADQESSQDSNVEFSENEEMLITMIYNLIGERLVSLKFLFTTTFYTKICLRAVFEDEQVYCTVWFQNFHGEIMIK